MTGEAFALQARRWTKVPGVKGIAGFTFSALDRPERHTFGTDGPDWRTLSPGLNFLGKCYNKKCPAHLKTVSPCQVGDKGHFGTFDVGRDTCDCRCPMCKEFVKDVTGCELFDCVWSYSGVMNDVDDESSLVSSTSMARVLRREGSGVALNGSEFQKFAGITVIWRYLEFNISRR